LVLLNTAAVLAVLAVIGMVGWHQLQRKYEIIRPIQYIGHSDEAGYALGGVSLAEGRGITVPYVSYFFIPYTPGVPRREDHWPPFMGFAMAPCVYFLGKAAWVCKLPSIFFGSVGLPLTAALLAFALSGRGYAGLAAGVIMALNPSMYEESLKTLSDVALAMLVAGFAGSVVYARKRPWMHVVAGAFLAGAYFAKGSQIILLGMYPVMAVLCAGPGVLGRRWFWGGVATAVLLMAPYWYGNWKAYGYPLHSTQNFVSGFYAVDNDWELRAYYPYWGHDLPKTSDLWTKPEYKERFWSGALQKREQIGRIAVAGTSTSAAVWDAMGPVGPWVRDALYGRPMPMTPVEAAEGPAVPWKDRAAALAERFRRSPYSTSAAAAVWLVTLAVLIAPVLLPLAAGVAAWRWWRRRKLREGAGAAPAEGAGAVKRKAAEWPLGEWGGVIAVALLVLVEGGFLSYLWAVWGLRFCFVFFPLMAALGCTAIAWLVELPLTAAVAAVGGLAWAGLRWTERGRAVLRGLWTIGRGLRHWHVAATLAVAVWALTHRETVLADVDRRLAGVMQGRGGYPFSDEPECPMMGAWIGKNLPNAVIMCRNPWELLFACGPNNRGIGSPNPGDSGPAAAEKVLAIAHYYGVTHLYADEVRSALAPYVSGKLPGFTRVAGAPGPLYEIDWGKIPVKRPEEVCVGPVAR
jgi:4-amino-4-deoxy-L-arabinose transferase-like glycosyltransferase